jgi:hypothetical protein
MSIQASKPTNYPFGNPAFALPRRKYTSRDGKSVMVCQARIPLAAVPGLYVEASIWARDEKNQSTGELETVYGVALPRGMGHTEGDKAALAVERQVQQQVLDGYGAWLDDQAAKGETPATFDDTPRLVRKAVKPVIAPAAAPAK